jgi:hypothetical protein
MDDPNTTTGTFESDEVTYTVSDEAIEAAAGRIGGLPPLYTPNTYIVNCSLSPGQCCSDAPARNRAERVGDPHYQRASSGASERSGRLHK